MMNFKKSRFLLGIIVICGLVQTITAADVKFNLDYTCIDINGASSKNIIREIDFYLNEGLLLGAAKIGGVLSMKNFLHDERLVPTSGDQNSFDNPSVVKVTLRTPDLSDSLRDYISLRLASVSPTLALSLANNAGHVEWGNFKVDRKLLINLNIEDVDPVVKRFIDFDHPSLVRGNLCWIADGDLVRILQLDESRGKILWESVVDHRNFRDASFNEFFKHYLNKENALNLQDAEMIEKLMNIDNVLFQKTGIDWINPVQITLIKNINPVITK